MSALQPPITFAVVVPCFNAETYLAQTLESALQQTHPPCEVLVVDDGSTDGSCALVEAFAARDARVRLVRTPEPSGGPSVPRNIGIAMSRADYVALLDADDVWGDAKLANDARFLERHEVDILFSGAYTFVDSIDVIRSVMPSRPITRRFELKNHVPTSSIVIRRAYCQGRRDVFDPDPLMRIEDYHFLLDARYRGARMANRPGIDTYYRHLAVSRVGRANLSESLRRQYYNLSKLAMLHAFSPAKFVLLSCGVTLRLLRSSWKQR